MCRVYRNQAATLYLSLYFFIFRSLQVSNIKHFLMICLVYKLETWHTHATCIKVNRNVQEEPQAEAAANPRHQEEEKKCHKLTCA